MNDACCTSTSYHAHKDTTYTGGCKPPHYFRLFSHIHTKEIASGTQILSLALLTNGKVKKEGLGGLMELLHKSQLHCKHGMYQEALALHKVSEWTFLTPHITDDAFLAIQRTTPRRRCVTLAYVIHCVNLIFPQGSWYRVELETSLKRVYPELSKFNLGEIVCRLMLRQAF